MPLSLAKERAATELSVVLYPLLPGSTSRFGNASLTFPAAANAVGLGPLWPGGSKQHAINALLVATLEQRPQKFTDLIAEIVRLAIRKENNGPVTRDVIERINHLVSLVGFRVPALVDPAFLASLPAAVPRATSVEQVDLTEARASFQALLSLDPGPRGFAYETFLNELFQAFALAPRGSFRLVGEQIDGSLELDLVEAKFQDAETGASQLLAFAGRVSGKATWTRGLFIAHGGFTKDGLAAFARGRQTNVICVNGLDLYDILHGDVTLPEALRAKARRASETNEAFVPIRELLPGRRFGS